MHKNQKLSLALALALGSSEALALGLGSIRVSSALNEPLVAEIPIVSRVAGETDGLKVRLASPEAFSRVGIDRAALLPANLQFTVGKDAAGQPVVKVTTPSRVGEPVLSFLLEVEWSRGKMMREYTVLLDPPRVAPARTAPAVTTPVREAPAAAAAPMPPAARPVPPPPAMATAPAPAARPAAPSAPATAATPAAATAAAPPPARPTPAPTPAPAPAPAPAPIPSLAAGDQYGPVASGETLWAIAQKVRPDAAITINQTMLALLRANPDAFVGENVNRLKRGAVLRIPSRDEFAALSAAAAAAEVAEQARSWRDGGTRVALPAEPVAQPERVAAVSTPARPTESRIELLPPGGEAPATGAQSGSSAAGEGSELRADLGRAREQVATLEQESRELRSRVADLESLDANNKRLLELKDSQLAEAQRRLAELEQSRTEDAAAPVQSAAVDAGQVDETVAVQDAAPADAAVAATTDATDAAEAADAADAADASAPAEPPVAAPTPVTTPVQETPAARPEPLPDRPPPAPWYSSPLVLGGGLAAIVAVLVLALLGRRGRKKPAPVRESVADHYAAASAAAASVAAEDAVTQVTGSELDALLDALAEQPNDLDRHLALAEYYYGIGDASGFEGAAEAMNAQLYDTSHPAWQDVLAMGRDLLPDHPLFAAPVEAASGSSAGFDFEESAAPAAPPARVDEDDDWGAPPPPAAANTTASAATTQNFSVEDIDRIRAAAQPAPAAPAVPDLPSFEFEVPEVEAPAVDLDMGAMDDHEQAAGLAAPSRSYASQEEADEAAATKLELARAYLDMGDVEGARGMLEEVIGEGNPGQRAEAKRLLDDIR